MPNEDAPIDDAQNPRDDLNDPERTLPDRNRSSEDEHFSFNDTAVAARIGRYVLQEKIGQGAFGVVYRSTDDMLGRQVAIKVLTRFSSSSQADAWVLEARVLANLDHAAIVPVYDVGKTDKGQPFIVSKLIDGGNLAVRAAKPDWKMEDSIRVITQLAQALAYLHQKGVMHRDIKPSNILTTSAGDAVLVDFGLALPEASYGQGSRFVGTPAYMSPEQARYEGHRVDGRSDIYSLGVVFYELLTGSRPFNAKDQEELLECIRTLEVRPPRQLNSTVPKELERICLKALSKRASDRYLTATDLVEDLVNWRSAYLGSAESIAVVRTDPSPPTAKPGTTTVASEQSTNSLDIDNVGVVPHGLRPFGQGDVDFFKHLLPGVRDRNGIPDSINFWIQRIESRSSDLAFRLGVLMGPSGSGKSSLIRAGVLPHVIGFAQTVYLEARPNDLEADLLKSISSKYPQYAGNIDLRELLIRIRSNSNSQRPKLLIVIDQFEQWLNHHRDSQITRLHEVLRQCDGIHIQAILLVRDDFLLGLSSFMEQLDESLLQNQNFATMEAFGVSHARKVLAAFGRAFGVVGQPPTLQQEQFIHEAIDKLDETGRLQPVQIALLSDMLKSKPWSPNTLRELGGIQGLEVAFLEERLAGAGANPLLRGHLDLVQRILKELLPTDGSVIKPPACPHSVLLERLKGVASEELLTKLLRLIDTEVRLITPSSRTAESVSGSSSSSTSDPAYQLTHDHLVITIRRWLNSRSLSTRAGRAAEQLHEISALWNAKPSSKRLPSILEWAAIRWLIPKSSWTAGESRMMRAAQNRFSLIAVAVCSLAAITVGSGYYWNQNRHAVQLVTRLLETNTEDLLPVMREVDQVRKWVLPKLDSLADSDPRIQSKAGQFRLALARLGQSDEAAEVVLDYLQDMDDLHQVALVRYIAQSKPINSSLVLEKTRQSLKRSGNAAVAQAALLCLQQPAHPAWPELIPPVCDQLLRKPNGIIASWPEIFSSLGKPLVKELLRSIESEPVGESKTAVDQAKRDLAAQNFASLMIVLANNDAQSLAQAVRRSTANSVPKIVLSASSPKDLSIELRLLLKQSRIYDLPIPITNKAEVTRLESQYQGKIFETGGWLTRVPLAELPECTQQLWQVGLGPQSARPYHSSGAWCVAITLKPMPQPVVVESELNEDQFKARFDAQQQAGFSLLDFASYESSPSGNDSANQGRHWLALWTLDPQKANSQVLLLGEPNADFAEKSKNDRLRGLVQLRFQVRLGPDGVISTDSLWGSTEYDVAEQVDWGRLRIGSGDLYPGYLQSDLRSLNTLLFHDRGTNCFYADRRLSNSISNRMSAGDRALIASRWSSVNRSEEALQLFDSISEELWQRTPEKDRAEKKRTYYRHKGRCLARLNRADELGQLLDEVTKQDALPGRDIGYLRLQLALLQQNREAVEEYLADLDPAKFQSLAERETFARSLATIACQDWLGERSNDALELLIKTLDSWSAELVKLQDSLVDVDFDKLRSRPQWTELLGKLGLTQRYSSCLHASVEFESQALLGLSGADHDSQSSRLLDQGFLPTIWHIHAEPNGELIASSVWVRKRRNSDYFQAKADQIAALVLALGAMNELDVLMDGLNEKWGRTVQATLIEKIPGVLPSSVIIDLLRSSSDVKLQSALLAVIGGFPRDRIEDADLRYLKLRLQEWSTEAKDASLMNMARFCASRLNEQVPDLPAAQPFSANRNWFTNSVGQQFVVIKPPALCLVGKMDDRRTHAKIGRAYALSTAEVTGEQFAEFYRDRKFQEWMLAFRHRRWINLSAAELPQDAISWLVAIQYCQWLNERERIPEDQWCYTNVWGDQDGGPVPAPNYLSRTGYRLPTHAEWEWACCAGSPSDIWSFGSSPRQSPLFEWTAENAMDRLHPYGQLRPNAFGLFDMGGNLAEWTDDFDGPLQRSPYEPCSLDEGNNKLSKNPAFRILAGGRYKLDSYLAAASALTLNAPETFSRATGMRLAKTLEVKRDE